MNDTEPARAVKDRIAEAIQAGAEHIGPIDSFGEDIAKPENVAITEWVLVMAWTDMETGEGYVTGCGSDNLLRTHRQGLLFDGLYHVWEDEER